MATPKESFFGLLKGSLNLRPRNVSGTNVGINNFFQQSAVTSADLSSFYGSEDNFMSALRNFEKEFYATVSDSSNLKIGANVDIEAMRASGTMDLSVLNFESRELLKGKLKNRVLNVGGLIEQFGLPGAELPNANLYSSSFRFRTLNQGNNMSPTVAFLNGLNIRVKTSGRQVGLDAVDPGDKIMGTRRLEELSNRSVFTEMFSGSKKVITFDTETTGVYRGSQIRSMAMAESVYENGTLRSVSSLAPFNFAYDAPHLGGLSVSTLNGGAEKMGNFLARIEGAQNIAENPEQFLDNANTFIKRLLEADVVAGHNVGFDVGMMDSTINQITGYDSHEIYQTLGDFNKRINQGGYLIDTADVARNYLINQVEAATGNISDLDQQAQSFIRGLYSPESLAKVTTGGSATYADVGNIVANTNLIELIEGTGNGVIDTLRQGSHIAETDVILQSYVANFIQTGELKIRSINPGVTTTAVGDEIRGIVARSSAITPTTNIADVSHLSAASSRYLKTDQGLRGAVAMVNVGDDLGISTSIQPGGHLRYMDGGYKYVSGQGAGEAIDVNSTVARQFLTDVIENRPNQLMSTGISYSANSAVIERLGFSGIPVTPAAAIEESAVLDAFGSMYENFGSNKDRQGFKSFMSGQGTITPFEAGLNGYNQSTANAVTSLFAAAGDPMAGFGGYQGRAFASVFAAATARVGMREGAKTGVAMTAHADLMTEGGLAYFETSRRASGIGNIGSPSKMQLPMAVVRSAAETAGVADGGIGGLTVSFMDQADDSVTANLVYNPVKEMNAAQKQTFYDTVGKIMSDSSELARTMGTEVAALDSEVLPMVNHFRYSDTAVADMAELADQNGIIVGSADVDRSVVNQLSSMGYETSNDVTLRNMVGRSVDITDEFDSRVVTVAMGGDETALAITGEAGRFANAAREKVAATERAAAIVSENESAVRRKVGRALTGQGDNRLLNIYDTIRPKAGLIGIGLAAAATGYYLGQRRKEVSLYNETLAEQPYEKGRNTYYQNQNAGQFVDTSSKRYDPLSSAGTVGNLDRSKIGHTTMGNRKYDHLFSGV